MCTDTRGASRSPFASHHWCHHVTTAAPSGYSPNGGSLPSPEAAASKVNVMSSLTFNTPLTSQEGISDLILTCLQGHRASAAQQVRPPRPLNVC